MTLAGARLLVRFSPRAVITAGGILAGLGVIISSQSTSPWVYTAAFGVLLGSGIGFIYGSASPTAMRWFPASKAGLISGIVIGGFGLGSAWVAPLARSLILSLGLQTSMLYLGIGMLVVAVGFAQFVQAPPAGFTPAGGTVKAVVAPGKVDFSPRQMMRTWQFYLLLLAFALGSGAGLMVIGNLASIVKDQIGLAAVSALAVSALAIGNGSGRVLYGMLSDRIGRKAVLLIASLFQAGLIVLLSLNVTGSALATVPLLMVLVYLIGANYGANLSVFPVITKDYYGTKNFAVNYGIVYLSWGLGGFMISQLAGMMRDRFGDFNNAYLLAIGILLAAAAILMVLKSPQPRMTASPDVAKPVVMETES
jgi:nitrate/nitrite transporter NarK